MRPFCTECSGFCSSPGRFHVDLGDLAQHRWPIAILATVGVLLSTVIVGGLTWGMLALIGLPMRFLDCLLFGALIPTNRPDCRSGPAQAGRRPKVALMIGNQGRSFAMSATTTERLDQFWELVDESLNAVLFVLIGLEVLALTFTVKNLVAGLLAIPIVLAARLISVSLPIRMLRRRVWFEPSTVRILTWGGLRGGISVALALSVPKASPGIALAGRDAILALTYVVVIFAIVVQGLTIGPLTRKWLAMSKEPMS